MRRPLTSAALLAVLFAAIPVSANVPATQTDTDRYARVELLAPETASMRITYDVSATTAGAREYVDPIPPGATASDVSAVDLMTGTALQARTTPSAIRVALARPVPANGQGRIRITKTLTSATAYARSGNLITLTQPNAIWRSAVVLPPGFALVACNVASQVLTEDDGRVLVSFMHQTPGDIPLVVQARAVAPTGPAAAPTPLTNARSWEPPPAQGPTERSRLTLRANQDRDIVYFLQPPATNAFALYHDYTESRPGTNTYINVVRGGSTVSNPSAYILDTGEVLRHETLKGEAITRAGINAGTVTAETEVVVIHFDPVKAGQSVRLRISETYTAPQSYRLEGPDLVFERNLGRARNSVVLPEGWYLTASAIPAVIRETDDGRVRLDFVNGGPGGLDVFLKARRTRAGR